MLSFCVNFLSSSLVKTVGSDSWNEIWNYNYNDYNDYKVVVVDDDDDNDLYNSLCFTVFDLYSSALQSH